VPGGVDRREQRPGLYKMVWRCWRIIPHPRPAPRRRVAASRGPSRPLTQPRSNHRTLTRSPIASRCSSPIGATLWWAFTWATLNWLLGRHCLWVFLWSFGAVVSPIDLLVAYGLANVLGRDSPDARRPGRG